MVVVSVPDDLHCDISLAAIAAGLHVVCEKPLALTAAQAKGMYERAKRAGVKHMTYFTNRWLPSFRYVHHLVAEGFVGRCLTADFRYAGSWGRGADYRWRFDAARGLGALGDVGSHVIDMARWLVGDVSAVCASLGFSHDRPGADGKPTQGANDSARLLLEFANGCRGLVNASLVSHAGGQQMRVILDGEKGTIEIDASPRDGYRVYAGSHGDKDMAVQTIPEEFLRGVDQKGPVMEQLRRVFTEHPVGCREFVDAILEDRQVSPSFHDGWKAQEVMQAALESDRQRRFVTL